MDLQKVIVDGLPDFVLGLDDLETDSGLSALVFNSIYSDERANAVDLLPGEDPRGYWAGDQNPHGSLLWLLDRLPANAESLERMRASIELGLAFFLADGIADVVLVSSTPGTGRARACFSIQIERGSARRSPELWDNPKPASFNLGGASFELIAKL